MPGSLPTPGLPTSAPKLHLTEAALEGGAGGFAALATVPQQESLEKVTAQGAAARESRSTGC